MLLVSSQDMIWLLFALLFAETLMWALFEPARSAVVPNIVSGGDIAAANALQSTTWSFNFAIGAALGGVVAAVFGRPAVFVLNSLSFVASALLVRRMRFVEPHAEGVAPLRWRDLADYTPLMEGVRYVRRDSRLTATLFVKAGLSLMGTNWVLLPMMGERLFPLHLPGFDSRQAATMGMSILLGSRGVGAVFGAIGGAWFTGTVSTRLRASIGAGFLMGGMGYLVLAGASNLWLACAALILSHAGGSMIWTSSSTLMQKMTDDRFRGRVFSAEFAFSMFILAAVSTLGGYLLDHGMSLRGLALATGVVFALPAIGWGLAQRLWRV
jgi:MFS family permease